MTKKSNYGRIEFVDKRKLKHDGWDDQIYPEFRKPNYAEREEIILNIVRSKSGKAIPISAIAEVLSVSDRTIQKHLQNLENQGLIKRVKNVDKNNRQRANTLEYIGPEARERGLTLKMLYDPDNPGGVRDWDWEDYKIIIGYFTEDFTRKDSKHQSEDLKEKKKAIAEKKAKLTENNNF